MKRIIILLFATALIAPTAIGQHRPDAADLILHNGVIWNFASAAQFLEDKILSIL
jgi:hypothetical protein